MSLKNRSALSGVDAASDARVRAFLERICEAPALHARFLNTLSLLEHVGSRKIMASQTGMELRQDTLKHLAEETRHAFFFKRAAETLAKRSLDYGASTTLAAPAARFYMGRLDAYIDDVIGDGMPPGAAYLYMSLIVELRAVWFYRLYQDVLAGRGFALSLKSILAEEEHHLDEMAERLREIDPDLDSHKEAFIQFEEQRFCSLWAALERDSTALQQSVA